ncbi:tyrosine-protein kinase yes-like [Ciona intestinalis]
MNPPNQVMPGQSPNGNMGIPFQIPPNQTPVYMPGQQQNMGGQVQIPPNQTPVYMPGQQQNMGGQVQIPVNQTPVYMPVQQQNIGYQAQNQPNPIMPALLPNEYIGNQVQINPEASNMVGPTPLSQMRNLSLNQEANPPTTKEFNYVAIWDYPPFSKGERMCILEKQGDWCQARTRHTKGYVPSNYVALVGSIECKNWFFGKKSEKECERMLIQQEPGTYMITESKTEPGIYRISFTVQEGLTLLVKHQTMPLHNDGVDEQARRINNYISEALYNIMKCRENEKPETSGIAPDVWEIDQKHLELQKKLGAGYFGEVWKGSLSLDGFQGDIKVAIKILRCGTTKDFLQEAEILRELRHPNIVNIYAVVTTEPIYIVTEFMCHGSLHGYLKDGPGRFFPFVDLIDMAAQIAEGMAFIEHNKHIHRDLRADNILVGENRVCKVADFGLARFIKDDVYMSTGSKFPIKWTAPEAIYESRFTIKSDVWSFGILLTEILTKGKEPYPGL